MEFFDYRCGYCKRAASALTELQQRDAGIRVVYKDFPILGETSNWPPKRHWPHICRKTPGISRSAARHEGGSHEEHLFRIADATGLDVERLDRDLNRPEWQAVIDRNRSLAKTLGITGTPAFIVGTELVPEPWI